MVTPIDKSGDAHEPHRTGTSFADLSALRVLIVEDDYYLAMEAKAVLEAAGAAILGPFPALADVDRALAIQTADCAVVDINLGGGPSYDVAERLIAGNVPFLFLTGYEPDAIPLRFRNVPQARKPANAADLVRAVALLARP